MHGGGSVIMWSFDVAIQHKYNYLYNNKNRIWSSLLKKYKPELRFTGEIIKRREKKCFLLFKYFWYKLPL